MQVSVIIVSWNTRDILDQCLASVFEQIPETRMEVFVVDNNSSDGSAEMVQEKYPQVHLIANADNRGFGTANNQAMRLATGRYILVLNPDTILRPDSLAKAITVMDQRPEVGILGARTFNRDMRQKKSTWDDPSLRAQLLLLTRLKYLFPSSRTVKKSHQIKFDYTKESFVDQIQGSFMLVRKEVLEMIGLFDENFFLWFEETDLCLRARQAGYKILYSPEVTFMHLGGESFKQVSSLKKQKMYNASLLYFFRKHKPAWQYYLLRLFAPLSLLLAALADALKNLRTTRLPERKSGG